MLPLYCRIDAGSTRAVAAPGARLRFLAGRDPRGRALLREPARTAPHAARPAIGARRADHHRSRGSRGPPGHHDVPARARGNRPPRARRRGAAGSSSRARRRGPVSSPRGCGSGARTVSLPQPDGTRSESTSRPFSAARPTARVRRRCPRDRARPRRRGGGLRRSRAAGLRAPRRSGAGTDPGAAARGEAGAARRARRLRPLPGDGPTDRPSQPHVARLSRDRLARGDGVRRHRPGPRGLPGVPDASAPRERRPLPPLPRSCARGRRPPSSRRASRCSTPSSRRRCPAPTSRITCSDTPISRRTARSRKTPWRGWARPTSGASATTRKRAFARSTSGSRSSSSTPSCAPPRSPCAARCSHGSSGPWRRCLRGLPAPRVLLALRLLNALVFALAVGVAAALAVALVPEPLPQWLAFPFLFVPSLPFFAMHVSETALLCSIYVLLAISLAVLFGDGPGSHWAGAAPRPGHRPDAGGRAFAVAAHRAGGGRPPGPGRARAVRGAPRPTERARLLGGLRPRRGRLLRPAGRRLPHDDGALRLPLRALHSLRPAGRRRVAPRPPGGRGGPRRPRPRCWRSRRARCAPGSPPGWSGGRGGSCGGRRSGSSRWSSSPSPPRCSFRFPSSRSSRSTR